MGGDLQATLSTQHHSYYKPLADFITNTHLQHLGDPFTPTYTPKNTPLDHWLLRLPAEARPASPTTTTAIPMEFSDHHALIAEIPQIGDLAPDPPTTDTYPTTRDHPPFILPIPKPLIDLYQLGNDTTRTAHDETSLIIQQLTNAEHVTTDQIDIAARMVVETIDTYHQLAQNIWPISQPPQTTTNTKLHPPITKSDTRQLRRITRLRNTAKNMLPKPDTEAPPTTDPARNTKTRTQATKILQLSDPPELQDIPTLCHNAIAAIINKANRKLTNSLQKKEDQLYKKSPKRYHNNLKTTAGLQPNAKDQPKLEAIRDPTTNNITTSPPHIIEVLQHHFEKEHSRTTPDHIPPPHGKTLLTRTPTPIPHQTHPHYRTLLTTTSREATTRPHATKPPLERHRDQMQSQMKSLNTSRNKSTNSFTSYSA